MTARTVAEAAASPEEQVEEDSSTLVLPLPDWVEQQRHEWGEKVHVSEWEADDDDMDANDGGGSYRAKNGWLGRDLIHDQHAPVRITEYHVHYGDGAGVDGLSTGGIGTKLTGVVQFTRRAESHRGYCHGGSMCSVMDDAVGWCGFMVTGKVMPWSGFTVQINTSLKKPIPVNATLLVTALVTKIERRKVSIHVELIDPQHKSNDESNEDDRDVGTVVHATAEGLVVINRGVFPLLTKRGSLETWPSSLELS
jgi:acyl-coenzyme A thioesterase PaaI-like protein